MKSEIIKYLDDKNIPHSMLGYPYLVSAISLAIEKPELKYHTCELYRSIAETHSATSNQVERCIRHAITGTGGKKIQNREFIARAVDFISPNFDWKEDKQ